MAEHTCRVAALKVALSPPNETAVSLLQTANQSSMSGHQTQKNFITFISFQKFKDPKILDYLYILYNLTSTCAKLNRLTYCTNKIIINVKHCCVQN